MSRRTAPVVINPECGVRSVYPVAASWYDDHTQTHTHATRRDTKSVDGRRETNGGTATTDNDTDTSETDGRLYAHHKTTFTFKISPNE